MSGGRRRLGRTGGFGLAVLACIFVGTGVPVYVLGMRSPRFHADVVHTAVVYLPAGIAEPNGVEAQLSGPGCVEAGLRRMRLSVGKDVVQALAANLRTTVVEQPERKRLKITLALTDAGGDDRARQLVDAVAAEFADAQRSRLAGQAAAKHAEASAAVEKARRRQSEAVAQRDVFLNQYFDQLALAESGQTLPPPPTPDITPLDAIPPGTTPHRVARPIPPEAMVVHAERARLERQLAVLRQHREQLLTDRTPLHPQVREADDEIAILQRRLAGLSQDLVPSPSDLSEEVRQLEPPPLPRSNATPRPSPAASPMPFASGELVQAYHARRNEANRAGEECRRLIDVERAAWEAQFRLPAIDVEPASIQPSTSAAGHSPRLMLIALAVGLSGALGLGMISAGASGEKTFANAAEARADLDVPVLGVLPSADPAPPRPRRASIEGWILVLCGLLLTAVCVAVMLAAIAGVRLA